MFGDPEFFDYNTLKQMGLWPDSNQMAVNVSPYINRLKVETPQILLYGMLRGDDIFDLLQKTKSVVFGYEKFSDSYDKEREQNH